MFCGIFKPDLLEIPLNNMIGHALKWLSSPETYPSIPFEVIYEPHEVGIVVHSGTLLIDDDGSIIIGDKCKFEGCVIIIT